MNQITLSTGWYRVINACFGCESSFRLRQLIMRSRRRHLSGTLAHATLQSAVHTGFEHLKALKFICIIKPK